MLEELIVRDFALIDTVELRFSPGFNILTGETGAGKSLLIGALSFVLGAKTDATTIRPGGEECVVTARFDISRIGEALAWLSAHDIAAEEGIVILRRGMKSGGRSYIYIQGQAVSRSDLVAFTSHLVDIHGQHEHQNLLEEDNHRVLLDRYAGLEERVDFYTETYRRLQGLSAERVKLETEYRKRVRESDIVAFQLREIDSAKLIPGEKEELEAEENILSQHERLFAAVEMVHEDLSLSGNGAGSNLRKARAALDTAAAIDSRLKEHAGRLADVFYEVEDIADNIASYRDSMSYDPQRLEWMEARLAEIRRLEKKYATNVEGVIAIADKNRVLIAAAENWEEDRAAMDAQIVDLRRELTLKGLELSRLRSESADRLAHSIQSQIRTMGMPHASISVSVRMKKKGEDETLFGPSGCDEVEFLISPNPGSPQRPLSKIASGGELSRVALAIKTGLAGRDTIETLIFDEIDAGIGGEAAASVGRHLKELGSLRQVLCITHLASIASMASSHFFVGKIVGDGITHTEIRLLSGDDRTAEIARMLAGDQDEETSLAHAAGLLKKNSTR